ncbi:MAG: HNH endonuclease [Smithella sp.]|jgi:5-methylcytosine-specific restriction endonuclease McrA
MKGSTKTKLDLEANKRDKFMCVECGKTSGIETHHIIPNLEELDNLVTLCHSCHKKRHNMAGCFKKGVDEKRKLHPENLTMNKKGSGMGKPFRGNRYVKI